MKFQRNALQFVLVGIWNRLIFAAISVLILWLGFIWATSTVSS